MTVSLGKPHQRGKLGWWLKEAPHYKKDRHPPVSPGSSPGWRQQPLEPQQWGTAVPIKGLPPASCTGGVWGCAVATTARWGPVLELVKVTERLQMTYGGGPAQCMEPGHGDGHP